MVNIERHNHQIAENGFTILDEIYSEKEVEEILSAIDKVDKDKETFRKSTDIFAIRQFLKEVPETTNLIFNENLKCIIDDLFGKDYFVVKSIYFDKPETSNWYVSYHQDLTISVDKKIELENYGPWTT